VASQVDAIKGGGIPPVDRALLDPRDFALIDGEYRPILGHANYQDDPRFAEAITCLAGKLATAAPPVAVPQQSTVDD